ncbi:MAG: hypothetical protein JXL84_09270 [Deltaproteobacteria bacterium]|nr:hypothetical protein [Deltaproteobacteria bacterium]
MTVPDMDYILGSLTDDDIAQVKDAIQKEVQALDVEADGEGESPQEDQEKQFLTRSELEEMMADPRYWTDREYRDLITKGFELLVGEQMTQVIQVDSESLINKDRPHDSEGPKSGRGEEDTSGHV